MPEQTSLQLGPNAVDYRVAFYKSILGNIPLLGGLLAEVVGAIIPEQQNDRLRQFVEAIEAKIQDLDPEQVETRFQEPEFIDLLQESLTQAVRAVAQERIEHIAEIVHQSLSDQDHRYIHFKKLLYILKELNNLEVLMLCMYGRRQDNDFWALHGDTTQVVKPAMGCAQADMDNYLVQESQRAHLVRLELLRPRFQKPKKGQPPELDEKTGMMKVKGYDIIPLGRLLLRTIGEPDGF
jgi:hypothetical protein